MTFVIQQLINAAGLIAIYALVALGVTLIFGLTGLVNFAHGEVMILGAFVTYAGVEGGLGFVLSITLGVLAAGALGGALWIGLFRHTVERPIRGFIVSLGLIVVLTNVMILIWGTNPRITPSPIDHVWTIDGARLTGARAMTIVVTGLLLAAYFAFVSRARLGRALRATNEDREAARLVGIPALKLIGVTFVAGSMLAGLAGGFLCTLTPITPTLGSLFIVKAFAVALIGGLGSPRGVLGGAVVLGVLETVLPSIVVSPEWEPAIAFGALVVVLIWRPQGLFQGATGSSTAW